MCEYSNTLNTIIRMEDTESLSFFGDTTENPKRPLFKQLIVLLLEIEAVSVDPWVSMDRHSQTWKFIYFFEYRLT